MNVKDLIEQLIFADNASKKKTDKPVNVVALVATPNGSKVLRLKEIGFNDKEAIIYIEIG